MKSEILSRFNEPWLPVFALILFVSIFTVMLIMVYRKESKEIYSEASELPLSDGVRNGR